MTTETQKAIATALALQLTDIEKVYSGTPNASGNHCRCGCRGTYRYNPLRPEVFVGSEVRGHGWPLAAVDINLTMVKRVLRALHQEAHAGNETFSEGDTFVDVELPSGRCYTAYFAAKGGK